MDITKLNGNLGAKVSNLDLATPLDTQALAELKHALYENGVICIATNGLQPQQLMDLARLFGEPEDHATAYHQLMEGYPQIVVLDSTTGSRSDTWHADETFLPSPPVINLLYAHQVPSYGGETAFISTAAAYDALSEGMKQMLGSLTALHDLAMTLDWAWRRGQEFIEPMAQILLDKRRHSHPVVMHHPETNRPWLNVNSTYTRFIENIPPLESEALLDFLYRHLQQPEFCYRHRWQAGDMVIWDQRGTQHYGVFDYTDQRVMHRVSIKS